MAYNLYSLVSTIERILEPHSKSSISEPEKNQLQILLEKSRALVRIFEKLSSESHKRTERFQGRIRDVARRVEDLTELAITDQIHFRPEGVNSTMLTPPVSGKPSTCLSPEKTIGEDCFLSDLQQETDIFSSMINEASMEVVDHSLGSSFRGISVVPDFKSQNIVVGLGDAIVQLMNLLLGEDKTLQVVSVVGMGGIGKTILAQKIYHHPSITSYFDCIAWATISQHYTFEAILSSLVFCITGKKKETEQMDKNQLVETLYKSLIGYRYLIVLDDVWATNVWDDVQRFFPDNSEGSRIIVTTRELDVANHASKSLSLHYQMQLLNETDSWILLRENVFGNEEQIGQELEDIGKNIAKNCKGLPLALQVISGFLSDQKTNSFWEYVANDVSKAASDNERFPRIFSMSYDHLPHHLKPCLLYIGYLPEDDEIQVSKITRLWAAEGFLKPVENKSPEEAAQECLHCLEKRNLLSVRRWKSNGKAKSYGVHDLVRDLCLSKANQEKCVAFNVETRSGLEGQVQSFRRVVFNDHSFRKYVYDVNNTKLIRLLHETRYPDILHIVTCLLISSRLLRTVDIIKVYKAYVFPEPILQLVSIRYLSIRSYRFPTALSRLWNLETLILEIYGIEHNLRHDLSEFRKLKHFMLIQGSVWITADSVLEKLETLSGVRGCFVAKFPNLTKLGICLRYMDKCDGGTCASDYVDLSSLCKLESLRITDYRGYGGLISPLRIDFSVSLSKITNLTLNGCVINKVLMETIGYLPTLTVLKVRKCDFNRTEAGWETYETHENGFESLRFLELEIYYLEQLQTAASHFPKLQHLVIGRCASLKEIPECIGDISTLQNIVLDKYFTDNRDKCESLIISVYQIQENQRDEGNDDFQLHWIRNVKNWRPLKKTTE